MVGIKVYNRCRNLEDTFKEWKDLGIDTIFPYPEYAEKPVVRELASKNKINLFLTVPIFQDRERLKGDPSLYAITQNGEKAIDDWVHFVCPSKKEYINYKIEVIKDSIKKYNPEGISLDFIRFFIFWEKVYQGVDINNLPQTCFDKDCIDGFKDYCNASIPGHFKSVQKFSSWILRNYPHEWTNWKCKVITETVKDISLQIKKANPEIKINIHTIPWRHKDFGGAIKNVAGQDFEQLDQYVDYISPMCYSHMLKRGAGWIHSVVKDVNKYSNKAIIPCIQVGKMYMQEELSPAHFSQSLDEAIRSPSSGIVLWSWKALASSPQKKEIFRTFISRRL